MNATEVSKHHGTKSKKQRKESDQESQNTQIVNQSSTSSEATFHQDDHYDECFSPLPKSPSNQPSGSSRSSFENQSSRVPQQTTMAKFLNVNTYEDAHLGPLDENPDVKRVFRYEPTQRYQPIPIMTSSDVISSFIDFQAKFKRNLAFGDFLDELVKSYRLQSRKELGLYCKSFPFLAQVSGYVRRNSQWYISEMQTKAVEDLISTIAARLSDFRQEMHGELGPSSYNKKKSPIAVFNHLASIIEKYPLFIPEQSLAYYTLIQLRQNELLQWLLNISIYLGSFERPDLFAVELDKICRHQSDHLRLQTLMMFYQSLPSDPNISQMDYGRLQTMIQQQYNHLTIGHNSTPMNTSSFPIVNTLLPANGGRSKLSVSLKQFCSYLSEILMKHETTLTVKQFLQLENHLCTKYNVDNFGAFKFNENDMHDIDVNLVSFLDTHQKLIDPKDELSVYGYNVTRADREELYEFVKQLIESNNDRQFVSSQSLQFDTDSNNEDIQISADNLSILEKAIIHKFGGLLGFQTGASILRKTKQLRAKTEYSIIRFEESLLDFNQLNRIDIYPPMPIADENQLCQFILQCPIMIDMYTWLQWTYFFEPKYGNLKTFIRKHKYPLQNLLLLETSAHELLRLPPDATLKSFEDELHAFHIRSAVGHLCTLINCEYGLTTRVPLNVYRTSIRTWFIHLQSSAMIQDNNGEPMKYILEFLTYLPVFIGQARLIQEIILGPLDDVFRRVGINSVSVRTRIWNIADERQRNKLEIWGHTLDINEWKNNSKWSGEYRSVEDRVYVLEPSSDTRSTSNKTIVQANADKPTTVIVAPHVTSSLSQSDSASFETKNKDESQSVRAAFEHIESIRRGFAVDSGLDASGQSIVNNLQGMIERSLQKLSNDLYSEQGHFVLELIQNADDNQYASDHLPTLRFVLSDKRILVCNNEIGFQPNNVDALCNVGATTKGKHKQGYAGHKGIGFKSVFMVSNCPEIHSRDYHFCFDTADGKEQIGYIRPIWLDKCDEVLPSAEEWTTCIRLPIERGSRLEENFDNIQAKLLLFLNRLRRIEIVGRLSSTTTNDQSRIFTRIDHADGKIIELQEMTTNGTVTKNLWLVVKKVLQVSEHIKEKLREVKCDVHSTTIAIAYPLNNLQNSIQQLPPAQPLFAYLPLRSYGFRFILQADFEIPVTRQEILHDNIWNEWLKNEMVQLIPLAYTHFQTLPDLLASSLSSVEIGSQLTAVQVLIYFLKLIPTRNELDPYFNPFVDKSMKLLMGIIKLPVCREDTSGQLHTEWVQPSQCILVKDPFIRKILPQELLLSHFNMYYVPEQLASECNERTLIKLGCAPLQFSSIIRLIKELYKHQEQEHSTKTSSMEQIAQWLLCIDYILQQQQEGEQTYVGHNERVETTSITELKQLKIIPLNGHSRLVSIDEYYEQVILFPLSKTAQYKKPFKIVLNDLPTLDERLLQYIEDKFPRRYESIVNLLKRLANIGDIGLIETPMIKEIYRLHVRPILLDVNRWSTKSDSVLIAFLLCIYTHFDQFENEIDQLKKHMVIKTRSGQFVRLDTPGTIIHLTSTYGCTKSLESLVSSKHEFTFISDDYINNYRNELFRTTDDINNFVRFLGQFNITEFLQINITDTHFINVAQLQTTQWAYLISELNDIVRQPFIIEDCCCNKFNILVAPSNNTAADIDLCSKLLIYLDRHHATVAPCYTASIILVDQVKSGRRRPEKYIPSTFCLSLRQYAWIPIESGKLAKPDDVYCLSPKSETSFFHRYVSHLDQAKVSLNNRDFILNILGLQEHVLPMTILELFMKWSCNLDRDALWMLLGDTNQLDIINCPLPITFRQSCHDTIQNIHRVYRFLITDNTTLNALHRFRLWPLVFVPLNNSRGEFLFAHRVYWQDSTSLLSKLNNVTLPNSDRRISIQGYYSNDGKLQKFFIETLQVNFEPTIDDYLPFLIYISNINGIWRLIEVIIRLAFQQKRQIEVKDRCRHLPFIPCMSTKDMRVKYTDQPLYPHDLDIANFLSNTLPIIQLPNWTLSSEFKHNFCLLFEIRSLADVIQLQVHVTNEQLSIDLFNFYSHSIELIQNFLVSKSFIAEERSKYLASIFARMHFFRVDQIQLSYHDQVHTVRTEMCDAYVDERAGRFYILKVFEKSEIRYIETMVKYLVQDRMAITELTSFIMKLSRIFQNVGEQCLIKYRDMIITQEHEYKWIFPNVYVTPSPLPIEEISVNDEPIDITDEMAEQLMNEPLPGRKPRSQITMEKDEEKNSTCFPSKANATESIEFSNTKYYPEEQRQSTNATNVTKSNHSSSSDSISEVSREPESNHLIKDKKTRESTHKDRSQVTTIGCSNSTSVEVAKSQRIRISTLTGTKLYILSSSSITTNPADNIIDNNTGRQGEEFVFNFLKWKHPDKQVKWMNERRESGEPYDIEIRKNDDIERIEVKTTRISDQHTFQISIREIQCLLENPMKYHIYRVYYSDDPDLTKITILSQVKYHLEQKQLALCMTIMQQPDEQLK
ncbi:unnamed protein product [Rotaria sordida]|uniref:Protein NO VEIN C-terminal domain-containing protein n=1 Tax=Rotaria sordida TaxID=392033 RepID=A0A814MK87_9BILA|nr:unnamed protein product [Rotaria sordida]